MTTLTQTLSAAISQWQEFNDQRKQEDPKIKLAIKEKNKEGVSARKNLADITKRFKKALKTASSHPKSNNNVNIGETGDGDGDTASFATAQSSHSLVEDVTKEGKQTVKAYQEEIDQLTKRCKSAEQMILGLYESLADLPDVGHLLNVALKRVDVMERQISEAELQQKQANNSGMDSEEYKKLRRQYDDLKTKNKGHVQDISRLQSEVEEYESEFSKLKNQDITIRKLEEEIEDLKLQNEEEKSKEAKKAQEELAEVESKHLTEAIEREAALERKLEIAMLELKAERAGRQSSQADLFVANEGTAELEAAWNVQKNILMHDNERLREELFDATRERDDLRLRVTLADKSTQPTDIASKNDANVVLSANNAEAFMTERIAYDAEIAELSASATALREELKKKDREIKNTKHVYEQKVSDLEEECSKLNSTVSVLRTEIEAVPSLQVVDQMKRELRILKRLEYNADDEESGAEEDPERTPGTNESDDVESILVSRLKKIEATLLRERREKDDFQKKIENVMKELSIEQEARLAAENLIKTLEIDLNRALSTKESSLEVQSSSSSTNDIITVANTDNSTLDQILDPSSKEKPLPADTASTSKLIHLQRSSSTSSKNDNKSPADEHSVASIIMAQRDRLRGRCDRLEAERDSFKHELQMQVSTCESLKTDNAKLYEKVKYLQNFRRNQRNKNIDYDRDLDLEALEQRYESSVDPFRQFSKAEQRRKTNEMSPIERIVYMLARQLLATKETRTALFCYILGMHFLVFMTTFHWSHSSVCDFSEHHVVAHLHHGPPKIENVTSDLLE